MLRRFDLLEKRKILDKFPQLAIGGTHLALSPHGLMGNALLSFWSHLLVSRAVKFASLQTSVTIIISFLHSAFGQSALLKKTISMEIGTFLVKFITPVYWPTGVFQAESYCRELLLWGTFVMLCFRLSVLSSALQPFPARFSKKSEAAWDERPEHSQNIPSLPLSCASSYRFRDRRSHLFIYSGSQACIYFPLNYEPST